MANHEGTTQLIARVAVLESLVDDGPGNTIACKRHETALMELKKEVEAIKAMMQKWGGALVIITFLIQIAIPIVLNHIIKTKP